MQSLIEIFYTIISKTEAYFNHFDIVRNTHIKVIELEKRCGWELSTIEKVKSYLFFLCKPAYIMVLAYIATQATTEMAEYYLTIMDMPIIFKVICFLGYEQLASKIAEELPLPSILI